MIFRSLPSEISALTFSNYLRKNQMLYRFSHRSVNLYIYLYVSLSFSLFISTQGSQISRLFVYLSTFVIVRFHTVHSIFRFVCLSLYFRLCPFPHRSVRQSVFTFVCLSICFSVFTQASQCLHLSFYFPVCPANGLVVYRSSACLDKVCLSFSTKVFCQPTFWIVFELFCFLFVKLIFTVPESNCTFVCYVSLCVFVHLIKHPFKNNYFYY